MRRGPEAFIVLQERHILYNKGLADRNEQEIGFLLNPNLADNVEQF